MEKEETKTEESTGVYLNGIYTTGPDVYVLSNRQNPRSAFMLPQEYGETNQTDTPSPQEAVNAGLSYNEVKNTPEIDMKKP